LSLIYGVKLTTNSTLCKRHFDAADTNENEIPLENNCALKAPNTYRNASKRSIIDNENDDLTIKKTKNNFSGMLMCTILKIHFSKSIFS
jgi:hypothetical protein